MNQYLASVKNLSCIGCHQIGQLATRTVPHEFGHGMEGWVRRIQSGQAGGQMLASAMNQLGGVPPKYLGDWTDRVAAGELPHAQPPRPKGVERNIVATVRDWATPTRLHARLERHRPPQAHGERLRQALRLARAQHRRLPDPRSEDEHRDVAARDGRRPEHADHEEHAGAATVALLGHAKRSGTAKRTRTTRGSTSSAAFGTRPSCARRTTRPRSARRGPITRPRKLFPLPRSGRQLAVYDPKTSKYTHIDTCYSTHHLEFAEDANNTLWTSGGGPVVGWLNRKVFDETGDVGKAQGWTAFVLDTNGNGKRDEYVEPDQPLDPAKDKRVNAGFYAVMPSPADGSIWGSVIGYPGAIVRVAPGTNPPATAISEIYNVPMPGYGARGADIDRNGVVWVSLGSGHIGSFDRRKCKGPLNGPKATGDHCPEGWSFFRYPGPGFVGRPDESVESSYYSWVDQHNTSGLGANMPMSTGESVRRRARARERRVRDAPHPVSARVLLEGLRGPDRRRERGLERPRPLGAERRPHAVAQGRRQGHEAARRALPSAAGSAREVDASGQASTDFKQHACRTARHGELTKMKHLVDYPHRPRRLGTLAAAATALAAEPEYKTIKMEIDVAKPAKDVWAKVGGYCDIATWLKVDCMITSGDGGVGTVRVLAGGRVTEILVGKTDLSYGYTQPVKEGQFYNLYHGFMEAKPVTRDDVEARLHARVRRVGQSGPGREGRGRRAAGARASKARSRR